MSASPGITTIPRARMILAPLGTVISEAGPTWEIFESTITIVVSVRSSPPVPSIKSAFVIARVLPEGWSEPPNNSAAAPSPTTARQCPHQPIISVWARTDR